MDLFSAEVELDRWFAEAVGTPTAIQRSAWPVLRSGRNALLIASTGQGKSLAAWRPVVERLVDAPGSRRGVRALHIAPLKALARDMTHNLAPLLDAAGSISGRCPEMALRCGDTPPDERRRQRQCPPEILSTTPESLFVLLGSRGGRALLGEVETVVVDELHALAPNKRGAHLALSLARLESLTGHSLQRIGLSATARPAGALAQLLSGQADCEVIEPDAPGMVDLRVEVPDRDLGPYPDTVHWREIHERIAALSQAHGPLLVYCQTRAQVERTAAALDGLLEQAGQRHSVGAHHGSLDTAHRETIEARFRRGELSVLVSSASLELGLDLGHVDRVCQIGVPGSINLVRQRAGRSRHRPGRRPCMHLFVLTLNQLVETKALGDVMSLGQIDQVRLPEAPMDVLAQHLVAMLAEDAHTPEMLLERIRAAWPWRNLSLDTLQGLLECLTESPEAMPGGQVQPLIRCDARGTWQAHPEASGLCLVNAGTIPEFFEYEVVRVDTGEKVGRLDEEFAFESSPGQVMQLGRRAWRICRVTTSQVRVEPADDEPVELPFWFGEGPGRTPAVAAAMLGAIEDRRSSGLHPRAARMLAESEALLGRLPGPKRVVIEQVSDPGGDRHVVLHTFAGSRINRAWGLALRKRFCRRFNFELQAAATDDGILISLGVTSRFELSGLVSFVRSDHAREVLIQALLDTPLFVTRFRWCANNSLVLLKNGPAGRVPAQRQRSQAENLIACVFPDQLACLENLGGPREVPDHPLVGQALDDCLREYMDIDGLVDLLADIERGRIGVHAVETPRPSPLAEALIHAPRHSYLDEADAEQRRTRNFEQPAPRAPRTLSRPEGARRVGAGVAKSGIVELPKYASSAHGLERLLLTVGYLTRREGECGIGMNRPMPSGGWLFWFSRLLRERRVVALVGCGQGETLWIPAERIDWFLGLDPLLRSRPHPAQVPQSPPPETADAMRAWLIDSRRRIDGERAPGNVERLFPGPSQWRGTG